MLKTLNELMKDLHFFCTPHVLYWPSNVVKSLGNTELWIRGAQETSLSPVSLVLALQPFPAYLSNQQTWAPWVAVCIIKHLSFDLPLFLIFILFILWEVLINKHEFFLGMRLQVE